MAIKLPELKVFTADELRAQHLATHTDFTKQVKDAVLELIAHHRPRYEAQLFEYWWNDIRRFIELRGPNETPYDPIARSDNKGVRDNYRLSREMEERAEERMAYLSRYTTFPEWCSDRKAARRGIDFTCHKEWSNWLSNLDRPSFVVEFLPTADNDLKVRAKKHVDGVATMFAAKTVDKVIDILLAKGSRYECHLDKGHFTYSGIEGDIKVWFPDDTGFRTHVIVKDNTSVLGRPYVQYPLTFHDVVAKTGAPAVAMQSADAVLRLFGGQPWKAPKQEKKPWTNVKTGDLVRTETASVCIILNVRGTTATVYHPAKGEYQIPGREIIAIHARTWADYSYFDEQASLTIDPHLGKRFIVRAPEEITARIRALPYGLRRDTEIRRSCLPAILHLWTDRR